MYAASNHPFLRDKESIYNINNPPLGMLHEYVPQVGNKKKFEGLEYFTKHSPRHQTHTTNGGPRNKKSGSLKANARYFKQTGLLADANSFSLDKSVINPGQ